MSTQAGFFLVVCARQFYYSNFGTDLATMTCLYLWLFFTISTWTIHSGKESFMQQFRSRYYVAWKSVFRFARESTVECCPGSIYSFFYLHVYDCKHLFAQLLIEKCTCRLFCGRFVVVISRKIKPVLETTRCWLLTHGRILVKRNVLNYFVV